MDAPEQVDGAAGDKVRRLASAYSAQWVRGTSPAELRGEGFADVKGKLLHQRRELTDGRLLFVVNSSLEKPAGATVTLKGRSLARLDLFTGTATPYGAARQGTDLSFTVALPPAGSLLLLASDTGKTIAPAKPEQPGQRVANGEPPAVKRVEPNAIRIDYCDLKLGDREEQDVPFYQAQDKVFRHHGFEGNPWNTAVQYKTSILDKNRFAPDSGFEANFHFDMVGAVATSSLRAVVERPELWQVAVNGKAVKARPGAWWLDIRFGVYDIGAHVRDGRNTITLTARPMSVHHELEPVYVVGDFGLVSQARGWKIVPAPQLTVGSWKDQKLPFYSHSVSYARSYTLRKGGNYKVQLGKWHGTVAEVKVNGKSAGIIGWQPYELDISSLATPGSNTVEVVVYGSLKNLLGPHHGTINRGMTGPSSFRRAPEHMPAGSRYDMEAYGLFEDFSLIAMP